MIAGGTGITPMLQALQALLGNATETTRVTLLYSNKLESDIIARSTLQKWLGGWHDRLRIVHTLTREPPGSGWTGRRGRIDQSLIQEWVPPPSASVLVFVCGPDGMYEAFTGPCADCTHPRTQHPSRKCRRLHTTLRVGREAPRRDRSRLHMPFAGARASTAGSWPTWDTPRAR